MLWTRDGSFQHLKQILTLIGKKIFTIYCQGVQWLSGRVLDSRPSGCGFKPHRRCYIVFFSKTHKSLLSTGSTQEDPSGHN